MKLYQPVMFVGLGGTGCDVGAELERKMREEICGPDGNDFRKKPGMEAMPPHQLPSCIQFVYADMNQLELDKLPGRVVPGPEHFPAAALTAHYVSDLVPPVDSYPDLARNLRLRAGREIETWLPPEPGEPKVNPLHFGAGQFPTVGRAALFGTFMDGLTAALRDISTAIGKLANSGTELHHLGGKRLQGVDVFVAFSVAGGTGCGIFYDYLHLIAIRAAEDAAAGEDLPAGADAVGVREGPRRRTRGRPQRRPRAARPVPPGRPAERGRRTGQAERRGLRPADRPGRHRGALPGGTADRAAPRDRPDGVPVLPAGQRHPRGHAPGDGFACDVAGGDRDDNGRPAKRGRPPVVRGQLRQRGRAPAGPRGERNRQPRRVHGARRVADRASGRTGGDHRCPAAAQRDRAAFHTAHQGRIQPQRRGGVPHQGRRAPDPEAAAGSLRRAVPRTRRQGDSHRADRPARGHARRHRVVARPAQPGRPAACGELPPRGRQRRDARPDGRLQAPAGHLRPPRTRRRHR